MRLTKDSLVLESFPVGTLSCNCSVIYDVKTREAIIIDPGNDLEFILSYVKKEKLKVGQLLHTHAHFDHIGASSALGEKLACPVLLHQGDLSLYKKLPFQAMFFGEVCSVPRDPDRMIHDEELFGFNQNPEGSGALRDFLKALHTPGHTEGSCSFYTEFFHEPLLLSGDTLFKGSIGRTDLPGGDHDTLVKSIRNRILPLPEETVCIPGHGPGTRIYEEVRSNPYF